MGWAALAPTRFAALDRAVKLSRILIAATGAEFSLLAGLIGVLGLCGAWSGALDALNHAAPLTLFLGVAGYGLTRAALPKESSRKLILRWAMVGVLTPAAQMAPDIVGAAQGLVPPKPAGAPFKVLHFNVWSENFDPKATAESIVASGADVVLMQEGAGPASTRFSRIREAYPYMASCKIFWICGQAIFSKRPITAWGALQPQPPLQQDSLGVVWAKTTAPDGKPVTLVTTHFSWPILVEEQAAQRAKLVRYLAGAPKQGMILSGDLNSTPWSFALRDLDDRLKPMTRRTRAYFSWPANAARIRKPVPLPFMPIDQLYAGPEWRTLKLQSLPRTGSDHYGVLVTLSR